MLFMSVYDKEPKNRSDSANYIKDHDFLLEVPIEPTNLYLVQYRHPLESLVSYFEFNVHHNIVVDTEDNFYDFVSKEIIFWKNFVGKWCLSNDNMNKTKHS